MSVVVDSGSGGFSKATLLECLPCKLLWLVVDGEMAGWWFVEAAMMRWSLSSKYYGETSQSWKWANLALCNTWNVQIIFSQNVILTLLRYLELVFGLLSSVTFFFEKIC